MKKPKNRKIPGNSISTGTTLEPIEIFPISIDFGKSPEAPDQWAITCRVEEDFAPPGFYFYLLLTDAPPPPEDIPLEDLTLENARGYHIDIAALMKTAETISEDKKSFTLADYKEVFAHLIGLQIAYDDNGYYFFTPVKPEKIKKPVYFTNQQLGDKKRGKQLGLLPQKVDTTGIILDRHERMAVEAIQVALHNTGYSEDGSYNGHYEVTMKASPGYEIGKDSVRIPGVYTSETQLLEAGGWSRRGNGRFDTTQKKQLRAALESLNSKMHKIHYNRPRGGVSTTESPIISLSIQSDFASIANMVTGDARSRWYQITPHHVFVDALGSFYFLQDIELLKQIEETKVLLRGKSALRGKKTEHETLFINWLLTKNEVKVKASKETLAFKLRLGYLAEQRQQARLRAAIQQAIDVAEKLSFIVNYEIVDDMYHFTLNPEKCSRLKKA